MKKILVIGGTGAMGVYLVPELVKRGYQVDVPSLENILSKEGDNPYFFMTDMRDMDTLKRILSKNYDAIIDFMVWKTADFEARYELFLNSTDHYIYLSSYRIYAGDCPITEESGRLLDVSDDADFLATEDYSLYKARGENMLKNSGKKNFTIVRPTITYSKFRYQLVTLEAQCVVNRAREGKTIVLPVEAASVYGTMTWAGDVAKMFAGILFNERAYGEAFTFATAEYHTWREIAEYYSELAGLNAIWVDTKTYCDIISPNNPAVLYQLKYDRLFNRKIDNSKILSVAGLKQEDLMPLKEGLRLELSNLPKDHVFVDAGGTNARMDEYLASLIKH